MSSTLNAPLLPFTLQHRLRFPTVLLALTGMMAVNGNHSAAAEIKTSSHFRSTHGVYDEAKAVVPRFEQAESLLWSCPLPEGISTPCLVGDRVIVTAYDPEEKKLETVAVSRTSGRVLWRKVCPAKSIESFHPVGSPAASTVATDGQHVYVFFGSYGLLCYDLKGNLQWSRELGPFQDEFGASSSPVLYGDLLILNEDHDVDSFLIAIDRKTGETVWQIERPESTRSYSTPVIWSHDGVDDLVVAGSLRVIGYDPLSGKQRWIVRGISRIVDSTPVVYGDSLIVATWTPGGDEASRIAMEPFDDALKQYDANGDQRIHKQELSPGPVLTRFYRIDLDQNEALDRKEWDRHRRVFDLAQNVAIAIKPGGRGDISDTHVKWVYRRGLPTVPSPLAYRGFVYMVKDSGIITVLDAESGELAYQGRASGRGNYYASPIAVNGQVCFVSERGVLTQLQAGDEWKLVQTHDFGERILATPVVSSGRFYLRTDQGLYCYRAQE